MGICERNKRVKFCTRYIDELTSKCEIIWSIKNDINNNIIY